MNTRAIYFIIPETPKIYIIVSYKQPNVVNIASNGNIIQANKNVKEISSLFNGKSFSPNLKVNS